MHATDELRVVARDSMATHHVNGESGSVAVTRFRILRFAIGPFPFPESGDCPAAVFLLRRSDRLHEGSTLLVREQLQSETFGPNEHAKVVQSRRRVFAKVPLKSDQAAFGLGAFAVTGQQELNPLPPTFIFNEVWKSLLFVQLQVPSSLLLSQMLGTHWLLSGKLVQQEEGVTLLDLLGDSLHHGKMRSACDD